MTLTFWRIGAYAGSVASSSASRSVALVDETSFACCRAVTKMVGFHIVAFARDISSPPTGAVTSTTELGRPRYDRPARYARIAGYAASLPMRSSASSGPITCCQLTKGDSGFGPALRTLLGAAVPV